MTKATTQKLILWLPLLVMAFYTSAQINKLHTKQTNYHAINIGVSATTHTAINKYVGLDLAVEGSKTHTADTATESTASQIQAGNSIDIKTGKDNSQVLIQGSHLDAGNSSFFI